MAAMDHVGEQKISSTTTAAREQHQATAFRIMGHNQLTVPRIHISDDTRRILEACGATRATPSANAPGFAKPYEIHAIFQQENWVATQDPAFSTAQWEAIGPALVLASNLLAKDTCLFDFFIRLTHAPLLPRSSGQPLLLGSLTNITKTQETQTVSNLENMASVIRCFSSRSLLYNTTASGEACIRRTATTRPKNFRVVNTPKLQAFQRRLGHDALKAGTWISIVLDDALVAGVANAGHDEAHQRRAHWAIAKTLVHEVAHAVWMFTRSEQTKTWWSEGQPQEPRVLDTATLAPDYPGWELGRQWENQALRSYPFAARMFSYKGKDVGLCNPNSLLMVRGDHREFRALSQDWIDKWFSEETWTKMKDDGERAVPSPEFCASIGYVATGQEGVWEMVVKETFPLGLKIAEDVDNGYIDGEAGVCKKIVKFARWSF